MPIKLLAVILLTFIAFRCFFLCLSVPPNSRKTITMGEKQVLKQEYTFTALNKRQHCVLFTLNFVFVSLIQRA